MTVAATGTLGTLTMDGYVAAMTNIRAAALGQAARAFAAHIDMAKFTGLVEAELTGTIGRGAADLNTSRRRSRSAAGALSLPPPLLACRTAEFRSATGAATTLSRGASTRRNPTRMKPPSSPSCSSGSRPGTR